MYDFRRCTMGLAPTRRDIFPAARKDEINVRVNDLAHKYGVKIVDIEDIAKGGVLYRNEDIPAIIRKFSENGVDCIFIPHANFGQEEACAKLCAAAGKPVLLWGPRDPAPTGSVNALEDRPFDVQCGLFATSKALGSYGVPFTYIENCDINSGILETGFDGFIRSVCAARAVKEARIAQLAVRPKQFLSVRINELELNEKFGIEVVPLESTVIIARIKDVLKKDSDGIEEKMSLRRASPAVS